MGTVKRRHVLRQILSDARAAAQDRALRALAPQRRPPGALPEAEFLARCTRCGQCQEACPQAAIFRFADGTGAIAATPVLVPEQRACLMCEGFPCVAACEDGALQPFEQTVWTLGRVRIEATRCLAHLGPECGACAGLCPAGIDGIELRAWKPRVTDACIGCGRCIEACPTSPPAIEMTPR